MILKLTLILPNDVEYVPVARTVSTTVLEWTGVLPEDISDPSPRWVGDTP